MNAILEAIAVPRLHGTPAAAIVEEHIRRELETHGYSVEDQPFAFSDWPGRWGIPVAGLLLFVTLLAATLLLLSGLVVAAAILLLVPPLALSYSVHAADRLVLDTPWWRCRGNNLFASKDGVRPRILVVAHRDSKSQGVPLAVRLAGVLACGLAWLLLLLQAMSRGAVLTPTAVVVVAAVGLAGAAILPACGAGNASPGALDNASGVVALLELAGRERDSSDIAFLVTDAEELGLAGSRAASSRFASVETVVNLDGLDDDGPIIVIEGLSPWPPRRGRMVAALSGAAAGHGIRLSRRGLPPGLLLDHVAFARAGLSSLSVMRGHVRALSRIHRPADTVARMSGSGAIAVAGIVHDALRAYRDGTV